VIIMLNLANRHVTLLEPEDFASFSVAVTGPRSGDALARMVRDNGLGRMDPDGAHVIVQPDALRRLAGPSVSEEWEQGFEGMCAYATTQGWVEDDGGIKAHIEARGG
jgi:hypothetical protein